MIIRQTILGKIYTGCRNFFLWFLSLSSTKTDKLSKKAESTENKGNVRAVSRSRLRGKGYSSSAPRNRHQVRGVPHLKEGCQITFSKKGKLLALTLGLQKSPPKKTFAARLPQSLTIALAVRSQFISQMRRCKSKYRTVDIAYYSAGL